LIQRITHFSTKNMGDAHLMVIHNGGKMVCREEVGLEKYWVSAYGFMSIFKMLENNVLVWWSSRGIAVL
jgi:hypothetical protein